MTIKQFSLSMSIILVASLFVGCGTVPTQTISTSITKSAIIPTETLQPTGIYIPSLTPVIGVQESVQGVTFNFYSVDIGGSVVLGDRILKPNWGYSTLCIHATYTGDASGLFNGPYKGKDSVYVTDVNKMKGSLWGVEWKDSKVDMCFNVASNAGPYKLNNTVDVLWSLELASLNGGSLLPNALPTFTPGPVPTKSLLQDNVGWYRGSGDKSAYSVILWVTGGEHNGVFEFQVSGFDLKVNTSGGGNCTVIGPDGRFLINPDGSFSGQVGGGSVTGKFKNGVHPEFTGTYSSPDCGSGVWTAKFNSP